MWWRRSLIGRATRAAGFHKPHAELASLLPSDYHRASQASQGRVRRDSRLAARPGEHGIPSSRREVANGTQVGRAHAHAWPSVKSILCSSSCNDCRIGNAAGTVCRCLSTAAATTRNEHDSIRSVDDPSSSSVSCSTYAERRESSCTTFDSQLLPGGYREIPINVRSRSARKIRVGTPSSAPRLHSNACDIVWHKERC